MAISFVTNNRKDYLAGIPTLILMEKSIKLLIMYIDQHMVVI